MLNLAMRHASRSIITNRLTPFAGLYDPGNEPDESETPHESPENPRRRRQGDTLVSVPLVLNGVQYRDYRLTLLQQDPHCRYCGLEVGHHNSSLDHIAPRSRGGGNWPGNLVLSCHACNSAKSDATVAEWQAELVERVSALQAIIDRLGEILNDDLAPFLSAQRKSSTGDPEPIRKPAQPSPATGEPSTQPPAEPAPGKWDAHDFQHGKRTYWIMDKATRKPLLRHLGINSAVHVIEHIGGHDLELMMLVPLHHDRLGLTRRPVSDSLAELSRQRDDARTSGDDGTSSELEAETD